MALDTACRPILTLDHVNPKNSLMPMMNKFQSEKIKAPFGLGKTKPKLSLVILFDNLYYD
jgi:hypothetical protein